MIQSYIMTVIRNKADLLALKGEETLIFDTEFNPQELIDLRDYPIKSITYGNQRLARYCQFPGKDFDAGKLYTRFSHIESAGQLPQSLESLVYEIHGSYFKTSFVDQIPFAMMTNLRVLKLHDYFNGSIDFEMLPNLESVDLGCGYNTELPDSFFRLKHLKRIRLVMYTHQLPKFCFPQLEELILSSYDHPIDLTSMTHLKKLTLTRMSHPIAGKLPHENLEEFDIGACHGMYNHPLDEDFGKFARLKRLMLGGGFNYPLPSSFRDLVNLSFLWLGNNFNQEVDGYLPEHLETLCFAWAFNRPLTQLPGHLRKLSLGHNFNQPLNGLPESLRELSLSWCYTQALPKWPSGLEELAIYGQCRLEELVLPTGLKSLVLPQRSTLKDQLQVESKLEEFKVLYPNTSIRFNG